MWCLNFDYLLACAVTDVACTLFVVPQVLGSILSRTMLLSIEVAVEYWLSLTWSPQAQWLSDSTHDSPLRDEVSLQLHADLGNNNSHRHSSRVLPGTC